MYASCDRIAQNRAETARMVQAAIARARPRQKQVASRMIRIRTTLKLARTIVLSTLTAMALFVAFVFGGPFEYLVQRLGYIAPGATAVPIEARAPSQSPIDVHPDSPLLLRLDSRMDLGANMNQPPQPKEKP